MAGFSTTTRNLTRPAQLREAVKEAAKKAKDAPTQIESYVLLAEVLLRLDRKPDADKVMDEMAKQEYKDHANSVKALQKYARYLLLDGKYEEALKPARTVLELEPEDPDALLIAGRCYLATGKYKTAEGYLNRGIKADNRRDLIYRLLAEVKRLLGRGDEAIAVLRLGLENTKGTSGYSQILMEVFNANFREGKINDAEKNVKELRGLGSEQGLSLKPQLLEFVEARLKMMEGEWKAAKEILVGVLPKLHDEPGIQKFAYLHLGQCCQQLVESDQQLLAYSAAVKIDPNFAPARIGLADIFVSRNNFDAAAEQYVALAGGPHPDPSALLSLARIRIMQQVREDKEKRNWQPVDNLLDLIQKQYTLTSMHRVPVSPCSGRKCNWRKIFPRTRKSPSTTARRVPRRCCRCGWL